jgi:hypothetical protein
MQTERGGTALRGGPGARRRARPGPDMPGGPIAVLVLGQATSTVGDACYAVALPWYVL